MKSLLISIVLFLFLSTLEADYRNTISLSTRIFEADSSQKYHCLFQYNPEIYLRFRQIRNSFVDSELSLRFSSIIDESDLKKKELQKIELYRGWLRYSSPQLELRAGLQKINFGSARLIRPLQWFDYIDPTDPLKNTQGVSSLLLRYFKHNSVLWLWVIHPEQSVDYLNIRSVDPEFGGRLQMPLKYCEAAFSFHWRNLNDSNYTSEERMGFDCRWDMTFGFWLEVALSRFNAGSEAKYSSLSTLGADYTLPWKNGILLLMEHSYQKHFAESIPEPFTNAAVTAIQASYPISLIYNFSMISSYDWSSEKFNYFCSLAGMYDYFAIFVNFFWDPVFAEPYQNMTADGKSLQVLLQIDF